MFTRAIENFQNWGFDGILLSKVEMYEFKIYRGVMWHDNEK